MTLIANNFLSASSPLAARWARTQPELATGLNRFAATSRPDIVEKFGPTLADRCHGVIDEHKTSTGFTGWRRDLSGVAALRTFTFNQTDMRVIDGDLEARTAIAAILMGAELVSPDRLLASDVTADDLVKAAVGKPSNPAGALQAFLLRRLGPPLIDPDLDHIPEGPTRDAIATMLEDPYADVQRIDEKTLRTTFDLDASQLAAYAKATLLDPGLAERGFAVGLTFTAGLRATFLDAIPFIVAAPKPYAIHGVEECEVLAPLLPGRWEVTLREERSKVSADGKALLKRSRTISREGLVIAKSSSILFVGEDLNGALVLDAPTDFGRAHFPFSGTVRVDHIDSFARASRDFQAPHMDENAAFELTGTRRRILHGMAGFGRATSLALGEIPGLADSGAFSPFSVWAKFSGVIQAGDFIEFAMAPAKKGLGSVLVRNRDTNKLLLTTTFSKVDPKSADSPS